MNGVTNGNEDTIPLPSAKPFIVSSNVVVQPPLTRRGTGPSLILIVPSGLDLQGHNKTLDPPPLQKWAEEGYGVAQIALAEGEGDKFQTHLKEAINGLAELKECDSTEKLGLICTFSWFLVRYVSDDTIQHTTHRLLKMFQASSTLQKKSWRS